VPDIFLMLITGLAGGEPGLAGMGVGAREMWLLCQPACLPLYRAAASSAEMHFNCCSL